MKKQSEKDLAAAERYCHLYSDGVRRVAEDAYLTATRAERRRCIKILTSEQNCQTFAERDKTWTLAERAIAAIRGGGK